MFQSSFTLAAMIQNIWNRCFISLNFGGMKCIIYLFPLYFFLSSCGSTSSAITDGNIAYEYKKYQLAASLLETKFQKETNPIYKFEIAKKIGDSYRAYSNTSKAEQWYKIANDLQFDPYVAMQYGAMLKMNEKYSDAIVYFEMLYKKHKIREAYTQREGCKYALEWMLKNKNIKVENLNTINTQYADFALVMNKAGGLVFSSSRADTKGKDINEWTGEKNSDIFILKGDGKIELLPDTINSKAYEGTCTYRDSKEIFFTRCGDASNRDNHCRIYYAKFENEEWSSPEPLRFFADSINIGHPSISKDGKKLFFVADHPNGFGGKDIYFSILKGGEWSEPYNAGRMVNSKGNEMFPFIDDNNYLYFSSDYHQGMGGLDIFRAELTEGGKLYGSITNLQYPINSSYDDFGIYITKYKSKNINDLIKEEGYFTSNRKGGMGRDDIYKYAKEHYNNFELIIHVVEKKYESPNDPNSKVIGKSILQDAGIELENLTTKEFRKNSLTNDRGEAVFLLDKNSNYKVSATKRNYFSKSAQTTTIGLATLDSILVRMHVEIELERIFPEKEIVINNIYYDLDKATLRPESQLTLDTLIEFFQENEHLTIEIGSHTDARGSNEYNQKLSQERAQSVVDYLISKKVNPAKIIAKGYGETKLVNKCADGVDCSEEEHQQNRRTTFRVVGEGVNLKSGE